MMINDKLITMKMKPRVAKHMAWGWRGGVEKRDRLTQTPGGVEGGSAGGGERYLDLGSGQQRLLFFRNDPDVEDSR